MNRPLRIEFSGALYHVTSRGDRREDIYLDDDDRLNWLEVLGIVCKHFSWVVHAYCLMSNHYHLVVETPDGNLSVGMRHLNGLCTQNFNRLHGVVGHLFQGRFKAVLVQKEAHLLELARAMWCSTRYARGWSKPPKIGPGVAIAACSTNAQRQRGSIPTGCWPSLALDAAPHAKPIGSLSAQGGIFLRHCSQPAISSFWAMMTSSSNICRKAQMSNSAKSLVPTAAPWHVHWRSTQHSTRTETPPWPKPTKVVLTQWRKSQCSSACTP
jgi:REP element-mobilizing transposase RayT